MTKASVNSETLGVWNLTITKYLANEKEVSKETIIDLFGKKGARIIDEMRRYGLLKIGLEN